MREQSAATGVNGDAELETSLDVEWVHALAPKATIELFEASDLTFADMFAEVAAAAATHPAAISMSWGENGGDFSDETYYDHFLRSHHHGVRGVLRRLRSPWLLSCLQPGRALRRRHHAQPRR